MVGESRDRKPVARLERMRRRSAAAAVAGVLLLTGCASGPTDDDRAAWVEWADDVVSASAGTAVAGTLAPSAAPALLTLSAPAAYTAIELRCIGSDRATFEVSYTGTGENATATQDIVCRGGDRRTPIAIPTAVGEVASVTVSATSPDGEGSWTAQLWE